MRITKINHIDYVPEELRARFSSLGEFVEHDDIPDAAEAAKRLADTDVAIVEWSVNVDREMIEEVAKAGRLKHIVAPLTDYSHIDVEAALEHGISVANCPATTISWTFQPGSHTPSSILERMTTVMSWAGKWRMRPLTPALMPSFW